MQDVVKVQVNSITTDHVQTLCLGRDEREQIEGKRTLIVDDVISTGESLAALEALVDTVGGNIVGKFTVLAEGEEAETLSASLQYLLRAKQPTVRTLLSSSICRCSTLTEHRSRRTTIDIKRVGHPGMPRLRGHPRFCESKMTFL